MRSRRKIRGMRTTGAKLQAPAAEHLPRIHQALAERRTLKTRYHSASRDSEDTRQSTPAVSTWSPTATSATRRGSSRWSGDTLEVRRWILGYGVQAEVVEPAGLREALRVEAEALARGTEAETGSDCISRRVTGGIDRRRTAARHSPGASNTPSSLPEFATPRPLA